LLEVEYRVRHAYGDWHWLSVRDTPLILPKDGPVRYILGVAEDINERRTALDKVGYISTHDQLTGLFNRAYFNAEVGRMEKSRQYPISILFMDIDDLRVVNETKGHEAGDNLITRTAQVLVETFRSEDIIARLGGDEFAVILPATGSASSEAILARIRTRLTKNNQTNTKTLLNISMGMATAENGHSLREAVTAAEKRMLETKSARRNLK
jgi:diguanylate cyclase (GGDEF)-like protein